MQTSSIVPLKIFRIDSYVTIGCVCAWIECITSYISFRIDSYVTVIRNGSYRQSQILQNPLSDQFLCNRGSHKRMPTTYSSKSLSKAIVFGSESIVLVIRSLYSITYYTTFRKSISVQKHGRFSRVDKLQKLRK